MQVSILTGQSRALTERIASAIDKGPITQAQWCAVNGLVGDAQESTRFHGGPERALHYYPREHYGFWRSWYQGMGLADATDLLRPGAFGENISGQGLQEQEACIGDIYRLDRALIQISQPRSPCYKLNAKFGYDFFSVLVQANGRAGWLLRVLEEGMVEPEATLTLVERPHPQMSVRRAADIVFNHGFDADGLHELAGLPALATGWRAKAAEYLTKGRVDDWSQRLLGPRRS